MHFKTAKQIKTKSIGLSRIRLSKSKQTLQQLTTILIISFVLSTAFLTEKKGHPTALISAGAIPTHGRIIYNLLQNPGFETELESWFISAGTAIYVANSTDPQSGIYCAMGKESQESSLGRLYQNVTALVTPGKLYKIGGWIKTEGVEGQVVIALNYVKVDGWTPADGYVTEIGYVTGTTDWTYYESPVFTLPTMPTSCVAVWFLVDFNAGKGVAWIDEVRLIEVTRAKYSFLFDEKRAGEDTLNAEYSEIASILRQHDHVVNSTTGFLDESQLSGFDILVITCPNGSYTVDELDAITSFVSDGGGLLLMGQWDIGDPTGINQIAGFFGVTFSGIGAVRDPDLGIDDDMPIVTSFYDGHPVCTGLLSMRIYGGRVLSIGNNTALAWGDANTYGDIDNNGQYDIGEPMGSDSIVMAAAEHGSGRAVFISDTDLFDNDFLQSRDHNDLFFNIIAWLVDADLHSLPAGAKQFPSGEVLDNSSLLIDLNIGDSGQTIYAKPNQTLSGTCTFQLYSGAGNPNEISQAFFIMSWTPTWPAPDGYYVPIYNGIPGTYPGVVRTTSFSFTTPPNPGTYYLYWCHGAHYSMRQAVDSYNETLALPAHAEIVVVGQSTAFSLHLESPSDITITKPQSKTLEITAKAAGDFNESIALTVGQLPRNITVSLSKSSIKPNETAIITISTNYAAPQGEHGVEIYGSYENMLTSVKIGLTILGPNLPFSVFADSPLPVLQGGSCESNIRLNATDSFNSTVRLSIPNLPPGISVNFSKSNIIPGENSTLAISLSYIVADGSEAITLDATSENYSAITTIWLDVNAPPTPFEISSTRYSWSIDQGKLVEIPISVTTLGNNFDFPINISILLPDGFTASWEKNTTMPNGNLTLVIYALPDAPENPPPLSIVGSSLSFSTTIDIELDVEIQPPPFWMEIWFWTLFGGVAGILTTSSIVQHYYRKWQKAKGHLDIGYLTTASAFAKLEELRVLGKISLEEYEKRRREYERKLRGE